MPSRHDIITPAYWQTEAIAYRTWRLQLSATPKVIPPTKDFKTDAELELKAARALAEQLGCDLPERKTLIDDESYWEEERRVLEGEEARK